MTNTELKAIYRFAQLENFQTAPAWLGWSSCSRSSGLPRAPHQNPPVALGSLTAARWPHLPFLNASAMGESNSSFWSCREKLRTFLLQRPSDWLLTSPNSCLAILMAQGGAPLLSPGGGVQSVPPRPFQCCREEEALTLRNLPRVHLASEHFRGFLSYFHFGHLIFSFSFSFHLPNLGRRKQCVGEVL